MTAFGTSSSPIHPAGPTCIGRLGRGLWIAALIMVAAFVLGPPAKSATPGLVAAYGLEEGSGVTVTDASGNGNNGTIANATWTSSGRYGNGLRFDGSSAWVTVPDADALHLTAAMTLEAWVNSSAVSNAWRDVIFKGDDNYYLAATSTAGSRPAAGSVFDGSYAEVFGLAVLATGSWTHLAATYDGSTLRLYVNGTEVSSIAKSGSLRTSTNPLQIGGDGIYGQYFQGLIDEVRVYNVALSAAQIETDMANPVVPATTPDTEPPSAPGTLTGSAVSGGEIDLSWGAASDNVRVTGYRLERCQGVGCSGFALIASPSGTSYNNLGLTAGTSYSYRVRATDAAGNLGPYSNVFTITTPPPDIQPPSAPGTLTGSAVSGSEIDLSWGAASDNVGVTGYRVERCQGSGCSGFALIASPSGTSYNNLGLTAGTTYSYRVRATDAAGNLGPYSNVFSASTPSGLVAAYSFGEGSGSSVVDASGNGNAGTVAGTTWSASGKFGNALSFNGTSARVTVADAASFHLTSGMTLEAWVNPAVVTSAWRDVIYKGDDNYYLEATSTTGGRPVVGSIFDGSYGEALGPAVLGTGTWAHLAATYDGSTLRLYVNGTAVSSIAKSGSLRTSTNPLQIGGDSLYGQYFQGLIDEVRVYNVALSAPQIQADMKLGINYPSAPGALSAASASGSEIDLGWLPATDGHGVSGYRLERCQGVGCTNFAQVAAPSGTSYADVGLAPDTSYSYRVRAVNTLGNVGDYSNVAVGYTGLAVSPRVTDLTFTRTQQFTARGSSSSVSWSVDGTVGGSAGAGTISPAGLYTPPSAVGTHTVSASSGGQSASAIVYVTDYAGTFTHHNDNLRTGANLNETVLTASSVNAASFGRLFSDPLDGISFASPLYVANLSVPGQGYHNVVYVATEHDSVYAYDADGLSSTPLWKDSFVNPAAGVTTVPAADTGECCDIQPEIGITGTPVIDRQTGTLYVVAKTKEVSGNTTSYVQRLHALDIATGAEKFGGPVVIQASVAGTGLGSQAGRLSFDPLHENQRPALLLLNGVVYLGFSSHGDYQPYHGWVLGYNASTLTQTLAYCVTANGEGAGVWQSGGGLAADATGSIYFVTGDGTFDANTGGPDYGDSFEKLTSSGTVADYFTPHDQSTLNGGNVDLGAGGLLLLPDQSGTHPHELVSAGKNGTIYLIDRDNMGHFNASNDGQIVQSLANAFPNGSPEPGNFSTPAFFTGRVYFSPSNDNIQAFQLSNGLLSTGPNSRSSETYSGRGGSIAVSASGSSNGILWALQSNSGVGVLHAYDATNLANELYSSDQAGTRDTLGTWTKFNVPLVANGRVFAAANDALVGYGLLP
jgi:chitodextrinase